MNVLGLYAQGPNTASCLVMDGYVVAFAEEERFNRIKMASNFIPVKSTNYCLKKGGVTLDDIDVITVGWNHNAYPDEMRTFFENNMSHPDKDEYSAIYENISLSEKDPVFYGKRLEMAFRRSGHRGQFPPVQYNNHHLSHAYSVFYPSPFNEAIILVVDGSGEEMGTSLWIGKDNKIEFKYKIDLPHSLGLYYMALTEYLGFSSYSGEGKVMGLAPYGNPNNEIREKLKNVMWIEGETYRVNPEYIYFHKRSYSFRHTDKLVNLLGSPPRVPESVIEPFYEDVAYEAQYLLEESVKHLVDKAIGKYNIRNICIAGGVAMNCKMNGVISEHEGVQGCFVIPASNDAGTALGSALRQFRKDPEIRDKNKSFDVYSGPEFTNEEIEETLKKFKLDEYRLIEDEHLYDFVANKIYERNIVGWFQGRMEVGSRALGNRSILADPRIPEMKDKVNREVKHREPFRPFAPSILEEYAQDYIGDNKKSGNVNNHLWMLKACFVEDSVRQQIPSVVHKDGSIRPQIVSKSSNIRYHRLISKFHEISGTPVLLNTSFNVRGEPIICRPDEAMRAFYSTGLDLLVMGNFVLEK